MPIKARAAPIVPLSVVLAGLMLSTTACERREDPKETVAELAKDAPVTSKVAPEIVTPAATLAAANGSDVAEFDQRIKDYAALRESQEGTLKKLSDRATPQQIDANQRALAALIAKARSGARVGDIFLPAMQTYVRGVVRRVLTGPDGPKIKASLMDENPMQVKIDVNGRYPDTIPMSTMPPDILSALPILPEDLEYRFVGSRLILLDVRSHVIVDYVANAFDL